MKNFSNADARDMKKQNGEPHPKSAAFYKQADTSFLHYIWNKMLNKMPFLLQRVCLKKLN